MFNQEFNRTFTKINTLQKKITESRGYLPRGNNNSDKIFLNKQLGISSF